jgi:hypothetical protein
VARKQSKAKQVIFHAHKKHPDEVQYIINSVMLTLIADYKYAQSEGINFSIHATYHIFQEG